MKKLGLLICLLIALSGVMSGCGKDNDGEETIKAAEEEYLLYYLNPEKTRLTPKAVFFDKKKSVEEQVKSMLTKLTESRTTASYKTILPDMVILQSYTLNDNRTITLDLSTTYYEADTAAQVLCRAAFVKSLTQIPEIDAVEFTIDTQPMMDRDSLVGSLTADVFVDNNTKDESDLVQTVTIYFTNVTGEYLEPIQIPINVGTNVSAEQLVIEELLSGTDERGYYNTMPKGTKLLSVSTKDGICYVDFSEEFETPNNNVKDQTVIYSVVNSLCELSTVSRVAFTINGEQRELYNGHIPFDQIFERNLDIVNQE